MLKRLLLVNLANLAKLIQFVAILEKHTTFIINFGKIETKISDVLNFFKD